MMIDDHVKSQTMTLVRNLQKSLERGDEQGLHDWLVYTAGTALMLAERVRGQRLRLCLVAEHDPHGLRRALSDAIRALQACNDLRGVERKYDADVIAPLRKALEDAGGDPVEPEPIKDS